MTLEPSPRPARQLIPSWKTGAPRARRPAHSVRWRMRGDDRLGGQPPPARRLRQPRRLAEWTVTLCDVSIDGRSLATEEARIGAAPQRRRRVPRTHTSRTTWRPIDRALAREFPFAARYVDLVLLDEFGRRVQPVCRRPPVDRSRPRRPSYGGRWSPVGPVRLLDRQRGSEMAADFEFTEGPQEMAVIRTEIHTSVTMRSGSTRRCVGRFRSSRVCGTCPSRSSPSSPAWTSGSNRASHDASQRAGQSPLARVCASEPKTAGSRCSFTCPAPSWLRRHDRPTRQASGSHSGPAGAEPGLASGHRMGLRHSAASVLLARGVPLTSVSQTSLASMCEGSRGGSAHWGSTTTVA